MRFNGLEFSFNLPYMKLIIDLLNCNSDVFIKIVIMVIKEKLIKIVIV